MKKTPKQNKKKQKELNIDIAFLIENLQKSIKNFDHKKVVQHVRSIPLNIHTVLIGIVILGVLGAINMIFVTNRVVPEMGPLIAPPIPPFSHYIAAPGIIEGRADNVKISTHHSGIIDNIFVRVGDNVKKGDKLFSLDAENATAELEIASAQYKEAEASLQQAQAHLNTTKSKHDIANQIKDLRAISKEDRILRKNAYLSDKAAFDKAAMAVESAKAHRHRSEIHLKQMIVSAPEDATVLQVNVHKGEFATTQTDTGHVLLGQTQKMQVRLDIDEAEAWRYKKGSNAKAYLRGNSTIAFDLDFDHIEPFILPKISLTSRNSEKVDTRVLQVVYSFETPAKNVYVGQQVDVIIDDSQNNKENS